MEDARLARTSRQSMCSHHVVVFSDRSHVASLNFTDAVLLQDASGFYVAHDGIRKWIPLTDAIAYLCVIGLIIVNWFAIKGLARMIENRWWWAATTGYVVLALI